jgi:hypothetical protein
MEDDLKISKVEYLNKHIGSYSNFKLILDDQTILYKFLKWRRPQMEDDLQ